MLRRVCGAAPVPRRGASVPVRCTVRACGSRGKHGVDDVSPLDQQTLAVYRAILFHKEHDPDRLAGILGIAPSDAKAALARLSDLSSPRRGTRPARCAR